MKGNCLKKMSEMKVIYSFSSTSLEKLFDKMENKNIPLIILDENKYNQTLKDGMVGYRGGE